MIYKFTDICNGVTLHLLLNVALNNAIVLSLKAGFRALIIYVLSLYSIENSFNNLNHLIFRHKFLINVLIFIIHRYLM